MSSVSKIGLRHASYAGLLLGAVCIHRADAAGTLNVCIDQANPTAQTDLRVARAIAKTQGYEVNEVAFDGNGKGDDGFPVNKFGKMAQGECQLIMGFPVDISNPNLPPNVAATTAYASTGFVLVRRAGAKNVTLNDIPAGSEVGIAQLDTYPGLLFRTHPNIVMHVYPSDTEMLADLSHKRILAGFAWQPSIEAYEMSRHLARTSLDVHVLPEKHMLWNLVALYGTSSQEAAHVFEAGLSTLKNDGKLEPLVAPFQAAAPVDTAHTESAHTETGHTSAQWPKAHMMSAVAWSGDAGGFYRVSDAAKRTSKVPALYTTDQATKGQLAYYQNCSMCHGPNLDGQPGGYSGPALKGADFADPSYNFHVSDIFNFVAKQMPAATPGSLSHEQDVQIMAFILQQNGYPAGDKELVYEEAEKSPVAIRYHGK